MYQPESGDDAALFDVTQTPIVRFWGEYGFLSNFYHSPMPYAGALWPTVEHLFQASKTFDTKAQIAITLAPSPTHAKRMGKMVKLRADWEDVKEVVMWEALQLKFPVGGELTERLRVTDLRLLIEGNTWHDNYWGDCTCSRCTTVPGRNRLGVLLMRVRHLRSA